MSTTLESDPTVGGRVLPHVGTATAERLGFSDPERALWGDPLPDLLGADQAGR